jgi:hypothetical protein
MAALYDVAVAVAVRCGEQDVSTIGDETSEEIIIVSKSNSISIIVMSAPGTDLAAIENSGMRDAQ